MSKEKSHMKNFVCDRRERENEEINTAQNG